MANKFTYSLVQEAFVPYISFTPSGHVWPGLNIPNGDHHHWAHKSNQWIASYSCFSSSSCEPHMHPIKWYWQAEGLLDTNPYAWYIQINALQPASIHPFIVIRKVHSNIWPTSFAGRYSEQRKAAPLFCSVMGHAGSIWQQHQLSYPVTRHTDCVCRTRCRRWFSGVVEGGGWDSAPSSSSFSTSVGPA